MSLENDDVPVITKKSADSEFDAAIKNIQNIVSRSQKAREERQKAAEKRKAELDAKREAAFAPIYERIETARENVVAIQEKIANTSPIQLTPSIISTQPITPTPVVPKPITPTPVVPKPVTPTPVDPKPTVISNQTTAYTVIPSPVPLTPSTIASVPFNISPITQVAPPPPVKTAPIDTVDLREDLEIDIMTNLIFENIGGQELINIARNDTVNGQKIIYQPIKNLTQIQQEYNPNNIVALQSTSDKYFQNFSIKFDNKVPEDGNGPSGAHIYIEPETGDLIVEAIDIGPDEQIELEVTTSGTIYEAEL